MFVAVTRAISPDLADFGPLSNSQRIDYRKASRQRCDYLERLMRAGLRVVSILVDPILPLAVFVEDAAVVVDEVAVMTRQGASARRAESETVSPTLAYYRPLVFMKPPATLDGGDVIRVDRTLFVGVSKRTNVEGVTQLRDILQPYGYEVKAVKVYQGSHLKSGCAYLGRESMLINRAKVEAAPFAGFNIIDVPGSESEAGNALLIGDRLFLPSTFTETQKHLQRQGFDTQTIDISEFQKAGGGLTCMSIIFQSDDAAPNGRGRQTH
jgi:dimethylargininase